LIATLDVGGRGLVLNLRKKFAVTIAYSLVIPQEMNMTQPPILRTLLSKLNNAHQGVCLCRKTSGLLIIPRVGKGLVFLTAKEYLVVNVEREMLPIK
jgi:hypothetical protein